MVTSCKIDTSVAGLTLPRSTQAIDAARLLPLPGGDPPTPVAVPPEYRCGSRDLVNDSKLYESDVQGGNQLCPRSHRSGRRRTSGRNRGSSRKAASRRLSLGSSSAHPRVNPSTHLRANRSTHL